MQGFLNINKGQGMTSHDVVNLLRQLTGIKQVGHAGTLDPMATGVLPIGLGKACRLFRFLDGSKAYFAEILLGTVTTSDDITGEIISQSQTDIPTNLEIAQLEQVLSKFLGEIEQIPPNYSAIHYGGKRLYELARSGHVPTDIAPRRVQFHEINLVNFVPPVLSLRVVCSSGTYIRSLARDLGVALGCGGCLQKLVRERAGPFSLKESINLDNLSSLQDARALADYLVTPEQALPFPLLMVEPALAKRLMQGQNLLVGMLNGCTNDTLSSGKLFLVQCNQMLIALCSVQMVGAELGLKSEVVLRNAESIQ